MKFKLATLFVVICLITGCNSCYSAFYKTNVRSTLNISVADSKLKSSFVQFYIDSVVNKNRIVSDSILYTFAPDGHLKEDERIIYFADQPKEAYLVILSSTPCQIYYIYNAKYKNEVIGDIHELPADEVKRIRKRFDEKILMGAESYKKEHKIADSVAYSLR